VISEWHDNIERQGNLQKKKQGREAFRQITPTTAPRKPPTDNAIQHKIRKTYPIFKATAGAEKSINQIHSTDPGLPDR
jgi:hypothetical protein